MEYCEGKTLKHKLEDENYKCNKNITVILIKLNVVIKKFNIKIRCH
jgi:hypothetical protein